jgi:hypothetical protein
MSDKSALELAESSEWALLRRSILENKKRAEEADDFGMMPLHWACTDRNVPLNVIKALMKACPHAVMMKNKGGLIPLHIAVKARATLDVLIAIIRVNDMAICEETPAGETAAELALISNLNNEIISYLTSYEEKLRSSGKAPQRRSKLQTSLIYGPGSAQQLNIHLFRSQSQPVRMLPPRWKLDKKCKICFLKFSYFKSRHHCRNCGESVCNTHSNRRLPLQHIGLESPQRVCILCYDELRKNGKPSAVVNIYARDNQNHTMENQDSFSTMNLDFTMSMRAANINPVDPSSILGASLLNGSRCHQHQLMEKDPAYHDAYDSRPRAQTELNDHISNNVHESIEEDQCKDLKWHARDLLHQNKEIENTMNKSNVEIQEMQIDEEKPDCNIFKDSPVEDISRTMGANDFARSHKMIKIDSKRNDDAVDVASTCNLLGMTLFEKGEYSSAILEYRKSVALNGRDAKVWLNLARALLVSDEIEDAEIAVRRALEMRTSSYASLSLLGKILHAKGEHDNAIEVFREALGLMNPGEDSDSGEEDIGSMTVGW